MYLTKSKELACVALWESISSEKPTCFTSFDQSGNLAENLCSLRRTDRLAEVESRKLGQSRVLRRFLPTCLEGRGKSGIQRRIRKTRAVRRRTGGPGRMRYVLVAIVPCEIRFPETLL